VDIAGLYVISSNCDNEADGDLLLIDELLAYSRTDIPTIYQNSQDTLQHLEEPALNTSGSRLSPTQSRLDDGINGGQGTRGMRNRSPIALQAFS